jgi:hypothetical protein
MKITSGRLLYKIVLTFFIFFQALFIFLYRSPSIVDSGSLTSASATLSNSRLSYYAKVSGAYNLGTSFFTIQSSANPDNNTNHLFPRDTINIGNNLNMTVATDSAATEFSTTANTTAQLADGDPVTASQSAVHTITFTTASAVTNPVFRVFIPAGTNTAASNDSGVDGGSTAGFDLNLLNSNASANVTCISNGTVSPQWGEYVATPSASYGNNLHAIECHYHGSLAASQNVTITVGNTIKLINPAPRSGHSQGMADSYVIKIKEYQYPVMTEVDTIDAIISPVEGVLASSTVNPSLSFQISGVSAGQSICGTGAGFDTNVTTSITSVPFGELTASDTFYNAAHSVSAATNASSGYTIQIAEDDEMSKPTTPATTITNTTCDTGPCTYDTTNVSTKRLWETATSYGWGYSLRNNTSTTTFQYSDSADGCTGGGAAHFCARPFACNNVTNCSSVNSEQRIAYSSAPSSSQSFWVCYRMNYGPSQATGYYQTRIIYFASATF